MQWQLGIWEPAQHLLEDRGKPRKPVSRWPVAGPSGCILTTSQQSGNIFQALVKIIFKNPVRTSKRTPHFTITKINWFNAV
jgi:hypothetical protein